MANLITKNTIETIPSYEVAEMMDKKHYEVLKMIQGTSDRDGIIQVLNDVQMDVVDFFIESTYVDSKGEERLCYECTKMGCDMLANKMTGKKGILFTAKYVKAFNDMQEAITQVGQLVQQQPLQIGPKYSYNNYWIKREMNHLKPTDIPEYVEGLLEYVKDYKPSDRLTTYEITRAALTEIQPTLTELWQREMVQASLNKLNSLIELQKTYINRTRLANNTKQINKLKQEIEYYKFDHYDTYYTIPHHGFTTNCAYRAVNNKMHDTFVFDKWKKEIQAKLESLPTLEEMGINPTEPIKVDVYFYLKDESMDQANFLKSFLDALEVHFKKEFPDFNDNIFADTRSRKYFNTADSFEEGSIVFGMKNLHPIEVELLTLSDDDIA